MTSFNISIQNMTCAGCAGRVERALNALGDTHSIVNLATHSASVDTSISPRELQQALQDVGYPARIDKVMIQIADIQAGAQADTLEREIIDHPSVTAASLNRVAQSIWVEFIAGTASPDEFLEIIDARDSLDRLSGKVKFSLSETWIFGVPFWRRFLPFLFLSLKWVGTFIH